MRVLKEYGVKQAVVVWVLLCVAICVFAGDIEKLEQWDTPLVFENTDLVLLGSGIKSFVANTAQMEVALRNDGTKITSMELICVYTDSASGFPLFQVEWSEYNIQSGPRIYYSSPFNYKELQVAIEDIENITLVWSAEVLRF